MRNKLETFTEFANSLFPHEIDYLISVNQFLKTENLNILNQINHNSRNPHNILKYNASVDKRSYSYVKNWITDTLRKNDVDIFFEWLVSTEKQILTDAITPDEEELLLRKASVVNCKTYYFIKFYELMQHYRDYLLIRFRTRYYQPVSNFLEMFKNNYLQAIEINHQLNSAALDIIRQHKDVSQESQQWEEFLKSAFFNPQLDGYSRYRAAVRLTVLYYNYREFDKLRSVYDILDQVLKTELLYSKRILANYYNNRAMMHSKLNELTEAEKYSYLSIRQKNSDYLFYLINLCGILLHQNKNADALKIMNQAIPEAKKTSSFYNRIGFVSFYIKTLIANNMNENAVSYGSSFLDAYKKEIFEHRWHLFFTSYFQALLKNEKYQKIINLTKRYKLISREKLYIGKAMYLPIILWYNTISEYIESEISHLRMEEIILKSGNNFIRQEYQTGRLKELIKELSHHLPEEMKQIEHKLEL